MSDTPVTCVVHRPPSRIAVIVPAHDEERLIGACLDAIERAVSCVSTCDVARVLEARVYVVCDACSDRTSELVLARGHRVIEVDARNVGIARAAGAEAALAAGADWLAFTDADTRVSDRWLVAQMALASDVVCGTIGVDDWGPYGATIAEDLRRQFDETYRDVDGHAHIHGANLGISAQAYRRVGGFAHLDSHEDVAIVEALKASGARIAWSAQPRVVTSARADYRAPAGFGAAVAAVAERLGAEQQGRAADMAGRGAAIRPGS